MEDKELSNSSLQLLEQMLQMKDLNYSISLRAMNCVLGHQEDHLQGQNSVAVAQVTQKGGETSLLPGF